MKKTACLILMVVSGILTGCSNRLSCGDGQNTLFDGSSLSAWRGLNGDSLPDNWVVQEGLLVVDGTSNSSTDIITKEQFSDFEFELEFKLSKGANSGIKYFVVEEMSKGKSGLGLEYQILDDQTHPDAKMGIAGNRTLASLYDLIAADPQKQVNPIGKWNQAKIVSKGAHVEHWLNGKMVLKYERGSQSFMDLIDTSKYKGIKGFGLAKEGHILLQDHGDKVWYRNIKVKKLKTL